MFDNHSLVLGQAAGSAFNILFKGGAGSAVDSVIPALLAGLEGDSKQASQALEGLRVILGVRPQTLSSMVRGRSPQMQCNLLLLELWLSVIRKRAHS